MRLKTMYDFPVEKGFGELSVLFEFESLQANFIGERPEGISLHDGLRKDWCDLGRAFRDRRFSDGWLSGTPEEEEDHQ
jgi:hypothetical protein